ncbi:MAG TPA: hypothetical protein VF670_13735 [Duganella sp.]|jgi:hypothetical protein
MNKPRTSVGVSWQLATRPQLRVLLGAAAVSLALLGCGGGDDADVTVPTLIGYAVMPAD